MYPEAYGADCNSSSNKPYGLPNFGGLTADPSLPQRCQDPTLMKVPLQTWYNIKNSMQHSCAIPCCASLSYAHLAFQYMQMEKMMYGQCRRG